MNIIIKPSKFGIYLEELWDYLRDVNWEAVEEGCILYYSSYSRYAFYDIWVTKIVDGVVYLELIDEEG